MDEAARIIGETDFYARQHTCYSAYMQSTVRSSVSLSVRPSHGWINRKRLKSGSCNFHRIVPPSS